MANSISVRWKMWHGAGQAGQSVQWFALGFLFLYYNQVLGLSGTLTGIGVSIAVVFDAISDPIVGSWSDAFRSRWGRRHPFLFASILPMGLFFVALFSPPSGLDEFTLFLWFTIFNILSKTALTIFGVPYLALGAEVSGDYVERTGIASYRSIIGEGSSLLVAAIGWNFFFVSTKSNPNPQLTEEPYFLFALASALVMIILMLASSWRTMDVIPKLPNLPPTGFSFKKVYTDLFEALRGLSFRSLFLGNLVCTIYWGTSGAMALHLKTFFWELDSFGIQWWHYAAVIGGICGVPFTPWFNRVLDKKWTVILGVVVCVAAATLPVALALIGLMPNDKNLLVPLLVFFAFLGTFGIRPVGVTIASMMGDMADEHELRHGTRQEGVYFAAFNFAEKCTGSLGPLFAGIAIDIVGLTPNSVPGEVAAEVLSNFGMVYIVIAIAVLFAIWVFWPYDLDKTRHSEIVQQLANRKETQKTDNKAISHVKQPHMDD